MTAFSLLELMIVLAVVATLLTIAVPSYQQYVQRSYRADAIRIILAAADCQGRIKGETGFFDTSRCLMQVTGDAYTLTYEPVNDSKTEYFTVSVKPIMNVEDSCGTLSMDHTGTRGISNTGVSVSRCWGGR